MKSVDAVLWRNTLMLRILIKPRSAVWLARVKILILKLLRIFNIAIINILPIGPTLAGLGSMVYGLTRGICMHEISLVGLVHYWTRWFCASYTLRFLILKDIWILLRITLGSPRTWTSGLKLHWLVYLFGLIIGMGGWWVDQVGIFVDFGVIVEGWWG